MLTIFLVLLAIACAVSLIEPRMSLLAILGIGFTQDPFRKLVYGEPFFFIVMVGVVFSFAFFSIFNRVGFKGAMAPFTQWTSTMQQPMIAFGLLLLVQFMHSFFRFANPVISFLGLLSYVAPLFAIIVGYYVINNEKEIRRFFNMYILCALVVAVTVILSFFGVDYTIFKEVGTGLKIYDQGSVLRSFSGIMRTGEVAAWHCAIAACLVIVMYFTAESKKSLLLTLAILAVLLLAVVLTGRRKMVMLFTIFIMFYYIGFLYYSRKLTFNVLFFAGVGIFGLWLFVEGIIQDTSDGAELENYLARGSSVYSEASTRFFQLGIDSIYWAYNRVGVLGGGLGIATQGSHLFTNLNLAGGAGESGFGKVMVELGLPGLIIGFWVLMVVAVYILRCISLSAQGYLPQTLMPLALGIAIILSVNLLTFSVATQVYGDYFVLIMLGLFSGFLFALPKLVIASMQE